MDILGSGVSSACSVRTLRANVAELAAGQRAVVLQRPQGHNEAMDPVVLRSGLRLNGIDYLALGDQAGVDDCVRRSLACNQPQIVCNSLK